MMYGQYYTKLLKSWTSPAAPALQGGRRAPPVRGPVGLCCLEVHLWCQGTAGHALCVMQMPIRRQELQRQRGRPDQHFFEKFGTSSWSTQMQHTYITKYTK